MGRQLTDKNILCQTEAKGATDGVILGGALLAGTQERPMSLSLPVFLQVWRAGPPIHPSRSAHAQRNTECTVGVILGRSWEHATGIQAE